MSMTQSAAELVDRAREDQRLPPSYRPRVSATPSQNGQEDVRLAFREAPDDGDQATATATATGGNTIVISPELVEPLSDAVIDTAETRDGAALVFRAQ